MTHCLLAFLKFAYFFSKLFFVKHIFQENMNRLGVANSLDPDQSL